MWQIELKNCAYTYQPGTINAHIALSEINLKIKRGELIAVIGAGGSGKSTLSLLMSGLYQPIEGEVLLEGQPIDPATVFRQIGIVFQYPEQQLFCQSVFDEVAFAARNFGIPEDVLPAKINKALTEVSLDPEIYSQRNPFELSGGQKKRVCIASVLAINPPIVIFDEPAAGLDARGKKWMQALIKQLNSEGKTVIWISHDMSEVAEIARRVIVLRQGRVIMDDETEAVFEQEELLAEAGLAIPRAAYLVHELKARGLPIPGQAVTVAEAFTEIANYLGGEDDV